jgi:hypothetical protein
MKNVTLSADADLIEAVRERARAEHAIAERIVRVGLETGNAGSAFRSSRNASTPASARPSSRRTASPPRPTSPPS